MFVLRFDFVLPLLVFLLEDVLGLLVKPFPVRPVEAQHLVAQVFNQLHQGLATSVDVAKPGLGVTPQHVRSLALVLNEVPVVHLSLVLRARSEVIEEAALAVLLLADLHRGLEFLLSWLVLVGFATSLFGLLHLLVDWIQFVLILPVFVELLLNPGVKTRHVLEALQEDAVLKVLNHLGVDTAELVGAVKPLFLVFLGVLIVALPNPGAL